VSSSVAPGADLTMLHDIEHMRYCNGKENNLSQFYADALIAEAKCLQHTMAKSVRKQDQFKIIFKIRLDFYVQSAVILFVR